MSTKDDAATPAIPGSAAAGAIRIVSVADTPVAMLIHRGPPATLDRSLRRFIDWRKSVGLTPAVSATYNILYGDPATVAPADYRIDLCVSTSLPIPANDAGIIAGIIPAGRCAVLRHRGSDDGLGAALARLVAWLPQSGHRRGDFPLYLQRVAFPPAVAPEAAITDLYCPLV